MFMFVLFCFRDSVDFSLYVMEAGRPEAGELVSFELLVCVDIYQHYH